MTIFEYDDYRIFLEKYIKSLPRQGRGQIGKMADHLRVHPSLISQILTLRRDLNLEQAQDLAEFLGLNSSEKDYFFLLLMKAKSGTKKLEAHFQKKINEAKEASQEIKTRISAINTLSEQDRSIFYSSWKYIAIWIFCSLNEKGKSIDEICEKFDFDRDHVIELLHFLIKIQVCAQDGGRYLVGVQKIHLESGSAFLPRHHANWRLKALSRIENLEKKELMFTAPFSISKKDFEALREEFLSIIQRLYKTVGETDPEDLACVNIDLLWINK